MKKTAFALFGAALTCIVMAHPARAQSTRLDVALNLVVTYWTYMRVCAEWTGAIGQAHTERMLSVAKYGGFDVDNKEHLGIVAARSIAEARRWQASSSLAAQCMEAKFALTN